MMLFRKNPLNKKTGEEVCKPLKSKVKTVMKVTRRIFRVNWISILFKVLKKYRSKMKWKLCLSYQTYKYTS